MTTIGTGIKVKIEKITNIQNVVKKTRIVRKIVPKNGNKKKDDTNVTCFKTDIPFDSMNCLQVQCANCKEMFPLENYKEHVCKYEKKHTIIKIIARTKEEPSTDFTPFKRNLEHPVFDLLCKHADKVQGLLENFIQNTNMGEKCQWKCILCPLRVTNEVDYINHIEKCHMNAAGLKRLNKKLSGFFRATRCMCGQLFEDEKFALDHVQKHHLCNMDDDSDDFINLLLGLNTNGANSTNEPVEPELKVEKSCINDILQSIFLHMILQCEFCDCIFSDTNSLMHHASQHNPSEGFACSKCDIKSLDLKSVLYHRRTTHNSLQTLTTTWLCNICSTEHPSLESLTEHRYNEFHFYPRIDWMKNELYFLCEFCLKVFSYAGGLIDHYNLNHKQTNYAAIQESYDMDIPLNISPEKSTKKSSSPNYTSDKFRQYLCEVCGKSYTQSSHLWQHLRFHRGVKPFACTVEGCDRKFTIRPDLNDHIRKCHTGERPFHCEDCGKRFLTGSVYYQHRLIHRGERRYGCEDCDKRFYRADALKNHQRIHTGEKPYQCIYCQKSFRQRGDRDKHIKARHPSLPGVSPIRNAPKYGFGKGRIKNNTACNPEELKTEAE